MLELISRGSENRRVAATDMNRESSRSHAVFTAIIKTISHRGSSAANRVVRSSRFHVVDLAGSERVKDTGAEGQRLKELCNINKSLSALGKVIYDLAENSKGTAGAAGGLNSAPETKQKAYINFRTSKLTHLLKDSLGGNAVTVMICTLNPHISAMKETLSTLKFARRAKMIRTQAVVNEDEQGDSEYWKKKYNELRTKVSAGAIAGGVSARESLLIQNLSGSSSMLSGSDTA